MTVAIVDYGSGNLRSAAKALERVADGRMSVSVTSDPETVRAAQRIVLPGVGAFGDCRRGLLALDGMVEAITDAVIDRGVPFLGICVGMQLMAERGHEHGIHDGLGWIAGDVAAIEPADPAFKIPHMGWNELVINRPHPVLDGLETGAHAYFVHSYALRTASDDTVLAHTDYGGEVVAVVGRDNMVGTQFHPEKSQRTGLRLIANFLDWTP
ncbi:MAG: imidazole glycerol phosphate synthase subunit HisH [Rhodospirillales bacterium]